METDHGHRRFGYLHIHALLWPQFPGVRHQRVVRRDRNARLAVRRRKKGRRLINERVPLQLARTINEMWNVGIVSDRLAGGRCLKYLTVADNLPHERLSIAAFWILASQGRK